MLIYFRATVFMRRETAEDRLFKSFLCKRKEGINLAIKTSSIATQKRINQYRLSSNFMFCNVRIMSYSKCSNWRRISKLSSNFGCWLNFCYLDGANTIETYLQLMDWPVCNCKLQVCNLVFNKCHGDLWARLALNWIEFFIFVKLP